jgi:hypothetical protein
VYPTLRDEEGWTWGWRKGEQDDGFSLKRSNRDNLSSVISAVSSATYITGWRSRLHLTLSSLHLNHVDSTVEIQLLKLWRSNYSTSLFDPVCGFFSPIGPRLQDHLSRWSGPYCSYRRQTRRGRRGHRDKTPGVEIGGSEIKGAGPQSRTPPPPSAAQAKRLARLS